MADKDKFNEFAQNMEQYEKLKQEKEEKKEFEEYKKNKQKGTLPSFPSLTPPKPHISIAQVPKKLQKDYIHKKVYADMVLSYLKELKYTQIGSMIGLFLTVILSTFNTMLSYFAVIFGVVALAWFFKKTNTEIATIQNKMKKLGYV